MFVRNWMSPDPLTVEPSVTVGQARGLLRRYGIRHLPVAHRGHLVGIVSDRDVYRDGVRLDQPITQVMSADPLTVSPGHTMEAAARRMLAGRVSCLPVIDTAGQLIGLVTTTDCMLASLAAKRPVAR